MRVCVLAPDPSEPFDAAPVRALEAAGATVELRTVPLRGGYYRSSLRPLLTLSCDPRTATLATGPRTTLRGTRATIFLDPMAAYEFGGRFRRLADRSLARLALSRVRRAGALTLSTALWLDPQQRKLRKVGFGIPDAYRPDTRSRPRSLVWVGRATGPKRPELFLELLRRHPELSGTMRCTFAPVWPQVHARTLTLARSLPNVALVTEPQGEAQIVDLYRSARIVLATSAPGSEGLHLPPLEGYFCGARPVVPFSEPYIEVFHNCPDVRFYADPALPRDPFLPSLDEAVGRALAEPAPLPDPAFREFWSMAKFGERLLELVSE